VFIVFLAVFSGAILWQAWAADPCGCFNVPDPSKPCTCIGCFNGCSKSTFDNWNNNLIYPGLAETQNISTNVFDFCIYVPYNNNDQGYYIGLSIDSNGDMKLNSITTFGGAPAMNDQQNADYYFNRKVRNNIRYKICEVLTGVMPNLAKHDGYCSYCWNVWDKYKRDDKNYPWNVNWLVNKWWISDPE